MHYLVIIHTGHDAFRRFRRFFKQHNKDYDPTDYCYAGHVVGNDEDGDNEGKDCYSVTNDNDDNYPGVEVISMDEWAQRFPTEGNLTTLPEFYLVETDKLSDHWKEFKHFHVDHEDVDDEFCPGEMTYVGNTESGWTGTDDQYDYPECEVLTLDEWKSFQGIIYSTF